jgi:Flp pilus assembly protein TadD
VKSEYRDLLVQPKHDDFALELDSRLGCALVDAGKFSEAVLIFREVFNRDQSDDKQRLQLFFGVALMRTGCSSEAQPLLFAAAKGKDAELAQSASECLSEIETTQ